MCIGGDVFIPDPVEGLKRTKSLVFREYVPVKTLGNGRYGLVKEAMHVGFRMLFWPSTIIFWTGLGREAACARGTVANASSADKDGQACRHEGHQQGAAEKGRVGHD